MDKNMMVWTVIFAASLILAGLVLKVLIDLFKRIALKNNPDIKELEEMMEENDLDFEASRDILVIKKLAGLYNISISEMELGSISVKQGDLIGLESEFSGRVSGKFIGLKKSNAEGYTYNYFLKTEDDEIISEPIEAIALESLRIYERVNV